MIRGGSLTRTALSFFFFIPFFSFLIFPCALFWICYTIATYGDWLAFTLHPDFLVHHFDWRGFVATDGCGRRWSFWRKRQLEFSVPYPSWRGKNSVYRHYRHCHNFRLVGFHFLNHLIFPILLLINFSFVRKSF